MFAALCLQASLLAHPLYLEDEPPELRSLRDLAILDSTSETPGGPGLDPEAALQLAKHLRELVAEGQDFVQLVRDHSSVLRAGMDETGVLGSFSRGALVEPLDRFLFGAEVGAISAPLVTPGAVHLAQRIETYAAVLQIQIDGTGDESLAEARRILAALEAGADFEELAKEHSDDRESAERGGRFAIFERGPRDSLLKLAAFETPVGGFAGPIRSAYGYHVLKRVPLEGFDPSLREHSFRRARAILIAHAGAAGADPDCTRSLSDALEKAQDIHARVLAGEDMAELAAKWNDDPGGRERRGDLGWVHRNRPDMTRNLETVFRLEPGELAPPLRSPAGFVVLRRER